MRFLVIITACLSIASALPQQSYYSAINPGEQGVSIVPSQAVYQDAVTDTFDIAQPRFEGSNSYAGANAGAIAGGSLTGGSNSFAGANAGAISVTGVAPGFGPGLPGKYYGAGGQSSATAISTATGGATQTSAQAGVIIDVKPAEVTKAFYYHVAQGDANANVSTDTITITPKKHYKVIFIKTPSASANAGSNSYAATRAEEKTLVYVLVGNPANASALSDAEANSFVHGKPEVYFVKYQGPQARAQATSISKAIAEAGVDGAIANAYAKAKAGAVGSIGNVGLVGGAIANANANANTATYGGISGATANANANARSYNGVGGQFANSAGYANAGANSGFDGQFANAAGYANAGAGSFGVGANPAFN